MPYVVLSFDKKRGFVLVLSRKMKNQTLTWGLIRILIWSR
nr:MAG TPA: hypothetical protein [Caudoviricetes sp.]